MKEDTLTTGITNIQRIVRNYSEQLCTNKLAKLEETDKFLERYNLPRLNA